MKVRKDLEYVMYDERGSKKRRMEIKPFLRPAMEKVLRRMILRAEVEELQIEVGGLIIDIFDWMTRGWFRRKLGLNFETVKMKAKKYRRELLYSLRDVLSNEQIRKMKRMSDE